METYPPPELIHSHQVATLIKANGGTTISPVPGELPLPVGDPNTPLYSVGGATDPHTGKRVPETRTPEEQFTAADVAPYVEAAQRSRSAGDSDAYVGGWTSEGKAVMDVSNAYPSPRRSLTEGVRRREEAIFAMRGIRDIPVPREPWTTRPGFTEGEDQGHLFRERTPREELRSKPLQHKIDAAVADIVQNRW